MAKIEASRGRIRLQLNTVTNARKTIGRLMRMRLRGELTSQEFRDLIYGSGQLCAFYKLEKELAIEDRLAEMESRIEGIEILE